MAFLEFHLAHGRQKTGSPSSPLSSQQTHLHITPSVRLSSCHREVVSTPSASHPSTPLQGLHHSLLLVSFSSWCTIRISKHICLSSSNFSALSRSPSGTASCLSFCKTSQGLACPPPVDRKLLEGRNAATWLLSIPAPAAGPGAKEPCEMNILPDTEPMFFLVRVCTVGGEGCSSSSNSESESLGEGEDKICHTHISCCFPVMTVD